MDSQAGRAPDYTEVSRISGQARAVLQPRCLPPTRQPALQSPLALREACSVGAEAGSLLLTGTMLYAPLHAWGDPAGPRHAIGNSHGQGTRALGAGQGLAKHSLEADSAHAISPILRVAHTMSFKDSESDEGHPRHLLMKYLSAYRMVHNVR